MRWVRWQQLFSDLEGQFDEVQRIEQDEEIADRTRIERANIWLLQRLRAGIGRRAEFRVQCVGQVTGVVQDVGADWVIVAESGTSKWLIPSRAVLAVRGLPSHANVPGPDEPLESRLGLGYALRGLSRDRTRVTTMLTDGWVGSGAIDVVGADYFELSFATVDEMLLPARGPESMCVSFKSLAALRRAR